MSSVSLTSASDSMKRESQSSPWSGMQISAPLPPLAASYNDPWPPRQVAWVRLGQAILGGRHEARGGGGGVIRGHFRRETWGSVRGGGVTRGQVPQVRFIRSPGKVIRVNHTGAERAFITAAPKVRCAAASCSAWQVNEFLRQVDLRMLV